DFHVTGVQTCALPICSIQGVVIEKSTNEAIPGASVQIQGTNQGTVTDIDGQFSLNVSTENPVLVVSFIGYTTQEIPVGNRNNITDRKSVVEGKSQETE